MAAEATPFNDSMLLETPASGSDLWVSGTIERVPTSLMYQLGLLVTAIALLVIPLLYVALIGATAFGVYHHATVHVSLLHISGPRIGRVLLYIGPIVAGSMVILILLKPLFAKRRRDVSCFEIERHQTPDLFRFIEVIATAVHAPLPAVVELSCEPNASVSVRRRWIGPLRGGLVLTIGTPFLAGMSTRQVAGVLAHEFGHFTQRMGMWSTHIIRGVEAWLARVVFERDAVDELLNRWGGRFWLIDLLAMFAAVCIWITRKILFGLLMIAHVIGCFMLRQMEYNADRHEMLLIGSKAFVDSTRRIGELHAAFELLAARISAAHDIGRLGDNFPMMVAHMSRALPRPVRESVDRMLGDTSHHPFATHPTLKNRIREAERVAADGVFRQDGPAYKLLRNFTVVCKWSTIGFYEMVLQKPVDAEKLLPYRSVLSQQQLAEGAHATLDEFFGGLLGASYLVFPDAASMQQLKAVPARAALENARRRMNELLPQMKPIAEKLTRSHEKLQWLEVARAVTILGIKSVPNPYGVPLKSEVIREHRRQTKAEIEAIEEALTPFRRAAVARMETALACLRHESASPGLQDRERLIAHMDRVLHALSELHSAKAPIVELMTTMGAAVQFVANAAAFSSHESFSGTLHDLMRSLCRELSSIRSLLGSTPLPIRSDDASRSIGSFLVPLPPSDRVPGATVEAAARACARYFDLYRELMGRLALMCLKVERSGARAARPGAAAPPQQ